MSTKLSLVLASLFLVIASTCRAQDFPLTNPEYANSQLSGPQLSGPQLSGSDLSGPIILGPESGFAQDSGPAFQPIPDAGFPGSGGIAVPTLDGMPVVLPPGTCEFYHRVRYKNKGKIAPCAQTMVVSVLDPCSRKCDCETKCVQVKICVPTCGCPKVKVSRTGRHTRYDYGKYAVDIYSNRNGTILIDYDA